MSTLKSNNENMTINADGASSEVKFQANGVEKASISAAGAFTSTTIDATKLTGNLPAIDGSSLTNLPAGGKVLQVVSRNSYTTHHGNSTTWSGTDLYSAITPAATGSSFIVMSMVRGGYLPTGAAHIYFRLYRDIAGGGYSDVVPTSQFRSANNANESKTIWSTFYIDAPTYTSGQTLTYKEYIKFQDVNSGTAYAELGQLVIMEIGS